MVTLHLCVSSDLSSSTLANMTKVIRVEFADKLSICLFVLVLFYSDM